MTTEENIEETISLSRKFDQLESKIEMLEDSIRETRYPRPLVRLDKTVVMTIVVILDLVFKIIIVIKILNG